MNTIWLDKYLPKKISDIIGHKDIITTICEWLKTYDTNNKYSSIIISGIHGIGKSIMIKLILEDLNYNIINISSTNIKDNKLLNKILLNVNNSKINSIITNQKTALVIDNIENITLSKEKEMLLDLYKNNDKIKKIPIIFLTNEQHSKLISDIKKTCFEIKLNYPTIDEFVFFIKKICTNENININDEQIYITIIKFTQYDVRKLIFILQDFKLTFGSQLIDIEKCKLLFQSSQKKDKDISLFDATRELLNNYKNIDKCLNYYESEKVLLPLMIFENYPINLLNRNYINNENLYKTINNISNAISIGDVIETNIYTDQNWYLQSLHGFYTCAVTTYELSKYNLKNKNYNVIFSSDLNKTSIKNINKKNIAIIQQKINKNINDILLLNKMIYYLLKREKYIKIKLFFKKHKLMNKYLETILKIDKTIEKINISQKIKKIIDIV